MKDAVTASPKLSREVLSAITIHSKYAKYLPENKRREAWEEIVLRSINMHVEKFPELENEIYSNFGYVLNKEVLSSMRGLQFGGKPISLNPARGFNCSYCPIDDTAAFSEAMFLLLSGVGFGYSVQTHHIAKLPTLVGPIKPNGKGSRKRRYLVGDSIEGWADAIKVLIESYFYGKKELDFDFSDIRAKGELLITSGGRAPGPQPLKDCIHNICKVLDDALTARGQGTKIKSIEAHDILCFIADTVLSGGIRRAAMISFFSINDEDMMTCKFGNWYETSPQRGRANNSVVLVRHKIKEKDFKKIWEKMKASGCGEPGIYFTNDKDMLSNPCCEASLKPNTFCNLATINGATCLTQEDLNKRARAAAFISTIQATYTEFHYLRDIWRENTEKDALIGVSLTGVATEGLLKLDFAEAAKIVMEENERVAKLVGINKAARTTLLKPEGTTSLVLGTSSGVHSWHSSPYYIRRSRISKSEALYKFLKKHCPGILEDDFFKPQTDAIMCFPINTPEGAISRLEPAIALLERINKMYQEWIIPGHRNGSNTHSVSATVSVRPEEWEEVGEWMWKNKDNYAGLTILPYDGGSYKQPPFSDCTEEEYNNLLKHIKNIDLTQVIEEEDTTNLKDQAACAGNSCSI